MYRIVKDNSDIIRVKNAATGKLLLKYKHFGEYIKLVWRLHRFYASCYHDVWEIEDEISNKFKKPVIL